MTGGGWVSPARAAWLLVRLRLARLFNQVISSFQRFRRKSASGQRSASPGKSKIGWLVGTLVAVSMLFSFTNIALQAVSNMQERLGTTTERRAEQGWLGAQLNALTLAEAQALGWQQPRGARLTSTVAGSPATKAGLLPGDMSWLWMIATSTARPV